MGDVESQERVIGDIYEPNIVWKHMKCHNETQLLLIYANKIQTKRAWLYYYPLWDLHKLGKSPPFVGCRTHHTYTYSHCRISSSASKLLPFLSMISICSWEEIGQPIHSPSLPWDGAVLTMENLVSFLITHPGTSGSSLTAILPDLMLPFSHFKDSKEHFLNLCELHFLFNKDYLEMFWEVTMKSLK